MNRTVVGFSLVIVAFGMYGGLIAIGFSGLGAPSGDWFFNYVWQFYYTSNSLYVFLGYTLPMILGVGGFMLFWIGYFILKGVEREARPVAVKAQEN